MFRTCPASDTHDLSVYTRSARSKCTTPLQAYVSNHTLTASLIEFLCTNPLQDAAYGREHSVHRHRCVQQRLNYGGLPSCVWNKCATRRLLHAVAVQCTSNWTHESAAMARMHERLQKHTATARATVSNLCWPAFLILLAFSLCAYTATLEGPPGVKHQVLYLAGNLSSACG